MQRTVLILTCAAALTACGPQPKNGVEAVAGPDGASAASSGGASATAVVGPAANVDLNDGAAITGDGQPAFAPKYPGGEVVTAMTAVENGRRGGVFAFTTSDPVERVFTWYRAKAEAGGLTSQTNIETAGARVYDARGPKGDVAITAAPRGGGQTYVQVTWSAKS